MKAGLEKSYALAALGARYGCLWVEYHESVIGPQFLLWKLLCQSCRRKAGFHGRLRVLIPTKW